MTKQRGSSVRQPWQRQQSPYERVKDAILNGTFAPGTSLVEAAVAEWCGTSRTPVREALTRLEQDGLIYRSERGLVVRERSPEEILEIYDTRIVLEAMAARVAAEHHTQLDKIRLERARAACEDVSEGDEEGMVRRNQEFHQTIWEASHNRSLVDLLDRLHLHLGRYPATTLSYPGRWQSALAEHLELADAVLRRDVEKAGEIADAHFTAARDVRLRLWAEDLT